MENLIAYFETIPSSHRSLILVGGITFFWVLEYIIPLFRFDYRKFRHAWPNLFFTLTTIIVNFILAFLLFMTSNWTLQHKFGVLQWFELPLWVQVCIALLILDLVGAWFAHWIQHKIKPFWRLHLIHHTDTCVDTTTANRHHPGESVIRFACTTLAVFLGGVPVAYVLLYQSVSVVLSQFNHANIKLPDVLDSMISWVIVSPDMHKVHHHYKLPYTDTNYGNIFSFWDRIFGTFSVLEPKKIIYGVDTCPEVDSQTRIGRLLTLPFKGNKHLEKTIEKKDAQG
ncbi:sterol desaturase family protein [Robertkochia solimangrovi]|uniref:sterol desaturase family protein n=1 Tax=Robertkochia solimangrovi TaxID=2213046 RepID=UPI0011812B69|nr:sterol desaturase family protein [Robertkochia solimangrovi]TRZ42023.1 sterol desaturase [Robertkochia solimangrovi]